MPAPFEFYGPLSAIGYLGEAELERAAPDSCMRWLGDFSTDSPGLACPASGDGNGYNEAERPGNRGEGELHG